MQIAIGVVFISIVVCVYLHLLALHSLWSLWPHKAKTVRESHIALMVFGCIVAHILEIAVFTIGLFVVATTDGDTNIALKALEYEQLDLWYYSASFYTSLGVGHTPPSAGLR